MKNGKSIRKSKLSYKKMEKEPEQVMNKRRNPNIWKGAHSYSNETIYDFFNENYFALIENKVIVNM